MSGLVMAISMIVSFLLLTFIYRHQFLYRLSARLFFSHWHGHCPRTQSVPAAIIAYTLSLVAALYFTNVYFCALQSSDGTTAEGKP